MASITRSPKSGSDWTLTDLDSYNIRLNQVDALEFFGLKELPQPSVHPELLTSVNDMQQSCHIQLICHLNRVMIPGNLESAAVTDFTRNLFEILGYNRQKRMISTRQDLPLLICGEERLAKADISIVDYGSQNIILIAKEGKGLENGDPVNVRAQLVAGAIGAFRENNGQREALGLPLLVEKVIPGIVMVGTAPVFFKIPVTSTLLTHIRHGTYPPEETCVNYCYPPVSRPDLLCEEGMKSLDNRRVFFQCYEALKAIVCV